MPPQQGMLRQDRDPIDSNTGSQPTHLSAACYSELQGWSGENISFGPWGGVRDSTVQHPPSLAQAEVRDHYLQSWFNDQGMRLVRNISNEVPGASEALLGFVHQTLQALDQADLDSDETPLPPCCSELRRVCRGFSALLHPVPKAYSAGPADRGRQPA